MREGEAIWLLSLPEAVKKIQIINFEEVPSGLINACESAYVD